jgi:hypothetical protein
LGFFEMFLMGKWGFWGDFDRKICVFEAFWLEMGVFEVFRVKNGCFGVF